MTVSIFNGEVRAWSRPVRAHCAGSAKAGLGLRQVMAAALLFGLIGISGPASSEVVTGERMNQPQPSVRDSLRAHRRDGPVPEFKVACWQQGQLILEEEGYDDFRRTVGASSLTLEFFKRTGRQEAMRIMSIGETTCAVYSNTLELPAVGGQ